MKTITILIVATLIFYGCKKNKEGKVNYKVKYSTTKELKSNNKNKTELHYTQFGNFITSLTPSNFTCNITMLRIYGNSSVDGLLAFMTLINRDFELQDYNADFTNNAEISVTPTLNGNLIEASSDGTGGYLKDKTIFKLFHASIKNIKQIVQLPVQYNGVNIAQFNRQYWQNQYSSSSVISGSVLTIDMYPLIANISDSLEIFKYPLNFYFGLTNSTVLYDTNDPITYPAALQDGHTQFTMNTPLIWSNKYNEWTYNPPTNGATLSITTTVGFDNENLIQIYAGADDIPYTSDDIFIYAPNFWERIYVKATSN